MVSVTQISNTQIALKVIKNKEQCFVNFQKKNTFKFLNVIQVFVK